MTYHSNGGNINSTDNHSTSDSQGGNEMTTTTYKNTIATYKTNTNFYLINKYTHKGVTQYILLDRKMMYDGDYSDEEIIRSEYHKDVTDKLFELVNN